MSEVREFTTVTDGVFNWRLPDLVFETSSVKLQSHGNVSATYTGTWKGAKSPRIYVLQYIRESGAEYHNDISCLISDLATITTRVEFFFFILPCFCCEDNAPIHFPVVSRKIAVSVRFHAPTSPNMDACLLFFSSAGSPLMNIQRLFVIRITVRN